MKRVTCPCCYREVLQCKSGRLAHHKSRRVNGPVNCQYPYVQEEEPMTLECLVAALDGASLDGLVTVSYKSVEHPLTLADEKPITVKGLLAYVDKLYNQGATGDTDYLIAVAGVPFKVLDIITKHTHYTNKIVLHPIQWEVTTNNTKRKKLTCQE